MAQLSLMIDLERCIGCKSCEAACKAEHGLGPTENRNRVVWLGETNQPGLDFLALSCQHCERPACLRACPVAPKAITKDPDTGVVAIDETRCTGCGECVVACPYGAMGYDMIDHHAVNATCAPIGGKTVYAQPVQPPAQVARSVSIYATTIWLKRHATTAKQSTMMRSCSARPIYFSNGDHPAPVIPRPSTCWPLR